MNCENCGNNKTTKITTALLGLVVVAALAGTMIAMPTMIGSAYGQSQACPNGERPVQGQCVTTTEVPAEVEFSCPTTPEGATEVTLEGEECVATGPASEFKQADCAAVGGTSTVNAGTRTCTFAAEETFTCPEGELMGEVCVITTTTKPGQGNRP